MSSRFSDEEESIIYGMIERLTGMCQQDSYKKPFLIKNFEKEMVKQGYSGLREYLITLKSEPKLLAKLLSKLTIHTTYWFRESRHFSHLEDHLKARKISDA